MRNHLILYCLIGLPLLLLAGRSGIEVLHIPSRGASSLEDPGGPVIDIPAGTTLCFATLGRWDPALLGSAGLATSSFGGSGSSHIDFKAGHFKLGDEVLGIPDQTWLADGKHWFSLVLREFPSHSDPERQVVRRGVRGSGWGHVLGDATQVKRYELMMNDQFEEFYNNTGDILFIYFFEDAVALPWGVDLNDFNLPEYLVQSSSTQVDACGFIYDWEIVGWNSYKNDSRHYEYRFVIKNTANTQVVRDLWVQDNTDAPPVQIRVDLKPGEGTRRQIYLKGMTVKHVEFR